MAHIAIGWFSDNVQTGIFLAEYKGWIKMNENLLIRQLITCTINIRPCFKKLIRNGCLSLSWMEINAEHKNKYPFLSGFQLLHSKIKGHVPTFNCLKKISIIFCINITRLGWGRQVQTVWRKNTSLSFMWKYERHVHF